MSLTRFLDYTGALDEDLDYLSSTGVEKIEQIIEDSIQGGGIVIPGMGTVTSVNNIGPDQNGNVPFLIDNLSDVTIDNTLAFSNVLFYDDIGFNPPQWVNKHLTTSLINEPQIANPPNRYFTESRVTDHLKTILTSTSDLLTRDATGNLIRVPKGLANQILTMNGTADAIIWKSGNNLISINDLSDVIITNPSVTQALKWNGTEWINENIFLSDIVDVDINSPANGDVLIYDNTQFVNRRLTQNDIDNAVSNLSQLGDTNIVAPQTNQFLRQTPQGKWANQSVSSQDIPEGGTSLYYNDTRVGNYLKTILTTEFDLLTRDGNNNLVRIPKGTSNQMLSMNQTADGIIWKDPSENISLNGLSDVTINNVANSQSLIYNVFTAQWENKSLTTDQVSQGLDVNRQYYTNQKVLDLLLDTLPEESILMNIGGNIGGLQKGATGTYLRSNDTSIAYSQVLYNEIRERQTMVRENITIPANGSINMLEWLMNSNIFNDMILPVGSPVNPFDWGTRGQQDYGMWHITNGSNQEITLDRVNIDLAANFIIFNFVRSLINIMDDNLQDGTVRIRPLGINHDQQGGDAQIINTTVNQLGRFRTLKQGTGITLTQTDNDITISSTGSYTNTDVSNYLLSILTSNEDILIRRANALSRLPHAVGLNDYLSYNAINGQLEWKAMPNSGVDELRLLQDCFLVPQFPFPAGKYVLFHDTDSGLDSWENHILNTSDILNLDTALNSKIPLSTVNAAGDLIIADGNASVTNLPKGTNNQVLSVINGNIEWAAAQGGATTLDSLTDVTITTPAQGQVLYKSNGDWVNQNLQISDITNLQTTIDGKLNNNFTAYGQIIIGAGGSAYQTFPKGNDNTFLQVQNGFLEYSAVTIPKVTNLQTSLDAKINSNILTTEGDILVRGVTGIERLAIGTPGQFLGNVNGNLEYGNVSLNVSQLSDVNINNIQNGQMIRYNSTTLDFENVTLDTSMVPENGSMYFTFQRWDDYANTKYPLKSVINVGTGTNSYTQLAGPDSDTKCLFGKSTVTTGLEWRQPTTSDVSDFSTGVNNILNGKYTERGRIQVSTGNNAYQELAAPTAANQVLVSDINNLLNNTGLSWRLLNLTDLDNIIINTPINGNTLVYNGASWVNSNALQNNINQTAVHTGQIATLQSLNFLKTYNPAVSPQSVPYNQIDQPIVNATYINNTALAPLDDFLAQGYNNADFITCGGGINGGVAKFGNFVGLTTDSQVASRLMLNGPNFSANIFSDADRINLGANGRINIRYTNNNINPGNYTVYAAAGAGNPPTNFKWYGLKNPNIVTAQMTTYTEPLAGADWDLLYNRNTGNVNNGNLGFKANITTNTTYFLIAIFSFDGARRLGALGFASAQTVNENYTFGNQLSLSNSTGDLSVSKNTALANAEQWTLSTSLLTQYFTQSIVCKVIRSIGQINLNNSIFEDYRVRINNVFSQFSYQNAAGTTTYLTVDTANDKVTIPRNGYYCASLQDAVIPTGINNNNFVFPINLGGGLVVENDNTPGIATFDGLNQLVTINRAGTYKIDFNLVYFPDNSSDNCEMFLLDAGGGAWQGCYKRNSAVTDKYTEVTMSTIRTWAVNDVLRPCFRSAQNAPFTVVVTSWALTITNMLTT